MGVNTTFFSKKSVASHSDSREIALWWQWREAARKTSHASSIQQQPQQALVFVRSALSSFTESSTEFHHDTFYGVFVFYRVIVASSFPTPNSYFQLPYSFHAKRRYPISLQLSRRVNNFSHLAATFTHPSTPCLLTVGLSSPLGGHLLSTK